MALQVDLSKKNSKNISTLRREDPLISTIIHEVSRVVIYKFDPVSTKWERSGVEGAAFIVQRKVSPFYSLVTLNTIGSYF